MWRALVAGALLGIAVARYFLANDVSDLNREHRPRSGADRRKKKRYSDSGSELLELCRNFATGAVKCMICAKNMNSEDSLWNCRDCFISFHLRCIEIWANSNPAIWSCPYCGHQYDRSNKSILTYTCFCGRINNPKKLPGTIPHSCGAVCSRGGCHRFCHPGKCPNDF